MPCSLVIIYQRFREAFSLDEDGDYRYFRNAAKDLLVYTASLSKGG
jgi:hypothetical protein